MHCWQHLCYSMLSLHFFPGKTIRIISESRLPKLIPPIPQGINGWIVEVTMPQGRVEVYYNNLWWRVCNRNWDDNDAEVACRQQNYQFGISQPVIQQRYTTDDGALLAAYLNDVECMGTENSLAECQLGTVQPFHCPFYRDAVVYCSNSKPQLTALKNQTGRILTLTRADDKTKM